MAERRGATCPICNCRGDFFYLGEQRWPLELARRMEVPAVIGLWSCPNCMTTVSEPDLLPARVGVNCEPVTAVRTDLHPRKTT